MTLHYATPTPPADPRHGTYSKVRAGCAWVVIAGSLLTVAIVNWHEARSEERTQASNDFQLLVSSRLALGEFRAFRSLKNASSKAPDQLTQQLKAVATAPGQKLRIVPVIAEISGAKVAAAQLEQWKADLNTAELRADAATLRSIYTAGAPPPDKAGREQLIQRQGWYGKLAASFGADDSDPLRREVMHASDTAFRGMLLFGLSTLAAVCVGVVLLIWAIVRISLGTLHRCYRPAAWRSSAFLEAFALYLAGMVVISRSLHWLAPHWFLLGTIVSLAWVPTVMLWPLVRGVSWSELKGAFGWYTGRGLFREIGAGITGYAAGLPIVALAAIITTQIAKRSGANTAHPIMFAETTSAAQIVILYLFVSVWAPLVEETLFRGALFNHLRQWHGWLLSAALSSFIFAALHPQGWAAIPVLGSIGFVLAALREWRGSMVANVTAHALNNAFVTTLLVFVFR